MQKVYLKACCYKQKKLWECVSDESRKKRAQKKGHKQKGTQEKRAHSFLGGFLVFLKRGKNGTIFFVQLWNKRY